MRGSLKFLVGGALILLGLALLLGMISSFAFLYPQWFNKYLPLQQLRPMHVSAAIFWIISGAAAGILYFKREAFKNKDGEIYGSAFTYLWLTSIVAVFVFYCLKRFGGREYWEFPPLLGLPILTAWLCLMISYYQSWKKRTKNPPLYVWMWTTGIVFFLLTFLEQNLYQIPWFRQSFLRDITVQWKSNGAMVGAWNQMIYGTSLYIMVRISGSEAAARSRKAMFFFFLGLTNLMFNWGHHIYNVPAASWIRHVSYAVSMTEWIILVSIMRDFRKTLVEQNRYKYLISYRFLIYAEKWILMNLVLALLMSIPAINSFTHGTHITVAHAMGATIGINTMILLSSLGYMLHIDRLPQRRKESINTALKATHICLLIFWLALIVAGIMKGYRETILGIKDFRHLMAPVLIVLHVFAIAGIGLFISVSGIIYQYFRALYRDDPGPANTTNKEKINPDARRAPKIAKL